MKKNILYLMFLVLPSIALTSCEGDSSEGLTRITYYPVLTMEGDEVMQVDKGTTFVDPGCTAEMDGEDVTDQIVTTGTVDTSTSGVYTITYAAYNSDGFSATTTRTVVVLDPNDPIEGYYDTDPASYRLYNGSQTEYGDSYEVLVINNGDGTYSFDDLLAGWYSVRAGYGTSYAMQAVVAIDDDGKMSLVSSLVSGWGDSASALEGSFDAATSTMTWNVEYTTYPMNFYVTMYKR